MQSFLVSSADRGVQAQGCGASLGRKTAANKQRCDVSNSFSLLSLVRKPHGRHAAALGCHQPRRGKGEEQEPDGPPQTRCLDAFVSVPALLETCSGRGVGKQVDLGNRRSN